MAAAEIADPVRSRGRSRHVPAFERVVASGTSAGGKERRPLAVLDTPTRYFSSGAVWRINASKSSRVGQTKDRTSTGNTSRECAFPPRFP